MKLFSREPCNCIIIIGCGRLGSALADSYSEQNQQVSIVDINENAFKNLQPSYQGFSIEGDGTDTDTLELAGIRSSDVLISVTDDDDANIMITQIAKQHYHVNQVFARVYDTTKNVSYDQMDIHVICPVLLSVNEVEKVLLIGREEQAV